MAIAVYRSPRRWRAAFLLIDVVIFGAVIGDVIGVMLFKNMAIAKTLGLLGFYGGGFIWSIWGIILGAPKTGLPVGKWPKENE